MNEARAKQWMQRLAAGATPGATPPFEQIEALARIEAAFQERQRTDRALDWIDAAWQSLALSALAAMTVWMGAYWS